MGNRLSRTQSVHADDERDSAARLSFADAGGNSVTSSSALLISESTTTFVTNYLEEAARILSLRSNKDVFYKQNRKDQGKMPMVEKAHQTIYNK